MRLLVGTSGYAYREWKGDDLFYPAGLPDREMLRYYGERFATVEINNTFYRMPSATVLQQWCEQVPGDFSFVLKASRRITHMGRLRNVDDSVAYLFDKAATLGPRQGPILFQLPPNLKKDLERLSGFLALLPGGARAAIEFRHPSWLDDEVYETLRSRGAALCAADGELEADPPMVGTTDWGYLRLRGVEYADRDLERWARRIRDMGWREVYVFFKHEDEATGPSLARRFLEVFGG